MNIFKIDVKVEKLYTYSFSYKKYNIFKKKSIAHILHTVFSNKIVIWGNICSPEIVYLIMLWYKP